MLFWGSTSIPANTPVSTPLEYKIKITKGTVSKISVYFPWGCAGLCGVQILHYTWQLLPLSRTEYLIGNDLWLEFDYDYLVDTEPYEVIVRAYNNDDTYLHTPLVAVEMLSSEMSNNLKMFLRTL